LPEVVGNGLQILGFGSVVGWGLSVEVRSGRVHAGGDEKLEGIEAAVGVTVVFLGGRGEGYVEERPSCFIVAYKGVGAVVEEFGEEARIAVAAD
jgi:hypothetical protein